MSEWKVSRPASEVNIRTTAKGVALISVTATTAQEIGPILEAARSEAQSRGLHVPWGNPAPGEEQWLECARMAARKADDATISEAHRADVREALEALSAAVAKTFS